MQVGDKAPEILGINEKGEEIRLSDYKGKKIVLYFYPKDMTSGCTAQACNLRDNYSELRKAGYEVIGVSVDNEKSHQKFIEKNNLPFPLIADTSAGIAANAECYIQSDRARGDYFYLFDAFVSHFHDRTLAEALFYLVHSCLQSFQLFAWCYFIFVLKIKFVFLCHLYVYDFTNYDSN